MTPTLATNNPTHGHSVYGEQACDLTLIEEGVNGTHKHHVKPSKLRVFVMLAKRKVLASLFDHVLRVISRSASKQVARVAAFGVITGVAHEFAIRDSSVRECEYDSVRPHCFLGDGEFSVTILINCTSPFPARRLAGEFVDFIPNILRSIRCSWHGGLWAFVVLPSQY